LILIVDSYAWFEFLTGGPRGKDVRTKLESSAGPVSPTIVLAEIARRFARGGLSEDRVGGYLDSIRALSSVVPIDKAIALRVQEADFALRANARARRLQQPSFADSIVLATAMAMDGSVITGDAHFLGLDSTVWIGRV
jgi:PIN domain nuclease of toxin-antitoxin system